MKKPKPKNPSLPYKEGKSKLFLGFILGLILCVSAYIVHGAVQALPKADVKEEGKR